VLVDLEALLPSHGRARAEPRRPISCSTTHSSVPVVLARPADLETALLNLLDNALKFSPPAES